MTPADDVFLSYSRSNSAYAKKLATHLDHKGVSVWFDDKIYFGQQWRPAIRQRIDACFAFIVVMTPAAESSTWVANEIARAQAKGKLILPLLLDGETFFELGHLHHHDVTDGSMPESDFVRQLLRPRNSANPSRDRAVTVSQIQTFTGMSSTVTSVSWSPDGRELACGSIDGAVVIWDPATP